MPAEDHNTQVQKALDRTIVLVGLMGAGKTSVGRRLAEDLGRPFIDIDHEIEAQEKMSVSDIFAKLGEPVFREIERGVIRRVLNKGGTVMATGGGAFMCAETRTLIKEKAISVWLKADLDVLVERVSRKNTRPLLEQGDKREILKKLMDARYPVYAEADYVVESTEGPHGTVVEAILHTLGFK